MSTGIFYPAANGDDGYWRPTFPTDPFYTDNDNPFGDTNMGENVLIRFKDLTIPQGSLIVSAFVRLTSASSAYSGNMKTNIYFKDDSDVPTMPTTVADMSGMSKTTAIAWDFTGAWNDTTTKDTPTLVTPLQSIVNKSAWLSGNEVLFLIENNGSATGQRRQVYAYDNGSMYAALHVEWTPGSVSTVCTWEPEDKGSDIDLTDDLLTASKGSVVAHSAVRSNYSKTSGLWYWEAVIASGEYHFVGIATDEANLDRRVGGDEWGWGYSNNGKKYHDGVPYDYGDTYDIGDVIGIALDVPNGKIWFSKNGVWQNSGDPVGGTGEAFSGLTGNLHAIWSSYYST